MTKPELIHLLLTDLDVQSAVKIALRQAADAEVYADWKQRRDILEAQARGMRNVYGEDR